MASDGLMFGAGIGGGAVPGNDNCGNIVIKGGTIDATGGVVDNGLGAGIGGSGGNCGNITISGGYVTAKGGDFSAGIGGSSYNGVCGVITITYDVTSVTATKGGDGAQSIGKGSDGEDITVNIEDDANVTQN